MPGGALRLLRTAILALVFVAPGGFAAEIDDLVTLCEDCHGPGGVSTDPDVPIIAGQPANFLSKTMRSYQVWGRPCIHSAFRHGDVERPRTDMCEIAGGLTADEIKALAEHFSALPFRAAQQPYDAELAAAGDVLHHQHCEMCHKEGGQVPDHGPRIAGQWLPYLRATLKFVPTGEHLVPPAMEDLIDALDPGQIDALLNYYASQQN